MRRFLIPIVAALLASSGIAWGVNQALELSNLTLDNPLVVGSGGTGATSLSAAGIAVLGSSNTFTATQNGPTCTLTDGASISWAANTCQVATVTLGGNRTLANPTSPVTGATYILKVVQDATGSRTLAYGANFAWPGGTAPTLTTTASHYDIETFYYDGTKMNGVWQGNFQ